MAGRKTLTNQQEIFAQFYAESLNPQEAAEKAGYSKASSRTLPYQLLRNEKIAKRINELREDVKVKHQVSLDMVILEMWKLASFDITEAFDENGKPKPIHELPEGLRKSIVAFETYKDFTEGVEVGEITKYKFADKTKAMDMLVKHLGGYIERTQSLNVNVDVDGDDMDSEEFQELKERLVEKIFSKKTRNIEPKVIDVDADEPE